MPETSPRLPFKIDDTIDPTLGTGHARICPVSPLQVEASALSPQRASSTDPPTEGSMSPLWVRPPGTNVVRMVRTGET
jgi:hypothetical protein